MNSNFCVMCGEEIPEGGQVCPICLKNTETSYYWDNVCKIQARQTEKGIKTYGQRLEDNTGMSVNDRLEYYEEELIDALMYIEHLKKAYDDTITDPDDIDDMIETIRSNYTFENQREMFVEECAEAIKASQKCKRTDMGTEAFNNFCEEVADVCIMSEQMKRFIGVKKINAIMMEKLKRQIGRLNND